MLAGILVYFLLRESSLKRPAAKLTLNIFCPVLCSAVGSGTGGQPNRLDRDIPPMSQPLRDFTVDPAVLEAATRFIQDCYYTKDFILEAFVSQQLLSGTLEMQVASSRYSFNCV